uniref:guanylate cyclase n=1 Tax=Tetraselmis sp. GSL018 TaxID=582737 RepID=A0A061QPS2_9CHLO
MARLGKGVDPGTPQQHRDPERGHDPESQTTGGVEASAVLVANPNFGQDKNKSSSDHGNGSLSRTRSRRRRWSSASISSVSGESDHIGVYDMMAQNKYQSLDENGHMVDAYRFKVSRRYLETDFIKEIQICTNLQHPNILMIYGVMMNGKNRPWLVMEEMEHGSLRDVLFNRSFRFEGEMLLNMLRDIATGMVFLHNCKPPILHRDLKPANVFLDRNMHAKLANFRITLKNRARGYAGTPYWMAPEVLRREGPHTKASDVYSMGILLYEIFTREKPYAGMNPAMVLEKVANRDLDEPFRPELPAELPLDVEALIHDCWAPNPELRPAFEEIRCRVNRLQVKEINKYFEARTARNPADVAKINPRNSMSPDKLYSQLFPQHVAQALRQGHKVDPEVFDCVTVFFCDVVGYTKMSSSMPANEVIDMLERLYTALDDLASKHDIFKVDTIGDAYLAVANLHKPQPDHAARIARFAVDAVAAANTTLVDAHNTKGGCVNIRGGFHSGCVVASVIGTHSPKYTIFGDTVNTASRMESLSEGNRIQCTKESAELIMPYAEEFGVEVVPRGRIDVKGKGTMSTFWVTRAPGMETIPSFEDSLL